MDEGGGYERALIYMSASGPRRVCAGLESLQETPPESRAPSVGWQRGETFQSSLLFGVEGSWSWHLVVSAATERATILCF